MEGIAFVALLVSASAIMDRAGEIQPAACAIAAISLIILLVRARGQKKAP